MATIEEALLVEELDVDIYRGAVTPTLLVRTFGGQVAGQALVSAVRTVEPRFMVHSLHGYFLRPGNPERPTIFLVERIRDGRSFCTRRVTGLQSGKAIFTMSASFHLGDDGPTHHDAMPAVPFPEDLPDPESFLSPNRLWFQQEWGENWNIRVVPDGEMVGNPLAPARQQMWFKYRHRLPDDPLVHVCALAYMSDMTLLVSAKVIHDDIPTQNASLDHAMWFLRPFRTDEWLLYDQTSPFAGNGRALTQGRIFDRSGMLVAAVVQEGLTRSLSTGKEPDRHATY